MSLLKFQDNHAECLIKALNNNNIAISTAETGTGKTYIAIYIAKLLNLKPLIICPKTIIYNWINVLNIFDINYYGISNYESFKNCKYYVQNLIHKTQIGTKQPCPFINKNLELNLPPDTLLILDEAHKCKNSKTHNAKILLNIDITKINYKILLLSATLADTLSNFKVFATLLKFCSNPILYDLMTKDKNFISIHKKIFPKFGGRIRIKDIPNFPQNIILPEKILMKNAAEIQAQYEIINAIVIDKEHKIANSNSMLEIILRARQKIEALKIPAIIDLTLDAIENKFSIVIFVNFKHTLFVLQENLQQHNHKVGIIHGDQSLIDRNNIIQDFQNNKLNIIILTTQTGGVGISLHDINGGFPRMSIISPSWSAQDLLQCLGRIHRAGGKSKSIQKIVFCANTIEEQIANVIQTKFDNYSQLNDSVEKSEIIINPSVPLLGN
jgi:superfamily II DNA or RNA helicase